jgi:drug/metabolite transporter (DMT)-like permease
MMQSGTAHLTSHALCLRRGGYRVTRTTVGYALSTGLMASTAMLCGIFALRHGEAVVIAPILQLGFLVSAPLSFVLIREPVTGRKLAGLALGAAAVVVFARQV